jgi:hypothetical protein
MATNHHDTGYKELFSHPEFVQRLKTVRHLLSFGVLSNDQIAVATGLSVDEIVKLRIEGKH